MQAIKSVTLAVFLFCWINVVPVKYQIKNPRFTMNQSSTAYGLFEQKYLISGNGKSHNYILLVFVTSDEQLR
jgi:hypothetical protein